jgi:K+ transporter
VRRPVPTGLAVAALGVVFGDIGTSPLYTLKTCFSSSNAAPTAQNAVGIVSLLIWTLFFVVCIKYVTVLMRIDHDGEGGILALLARAEPPRILGVPLRIDWILWVAVIGGAMIIGDGMITPAISVISAVEGLRVATPAAQPLIVPISGGILLGLFAIQWRGTQRVGIVFGPIMAAWFAAIGAAGLVAIVKHPAILAALNPLRAVWFVSHHGIFGFLIFGAIILGMTGAEALYADMSHFGRVPITIAWYAFVFPALILNYVGQGAVIAADPAALDSPFYALASGGALLPMVALATAATVIASHWLPVAVAAVISLTALTWLTGRRAVARELYGRQASIARFVAEHAALERPPVGAVVLLSADPTGVPFVGDHPWLERLIVDEIVILLTVKWVPIPRISEIERVQIEHVSDRLVRVGAIFGYMETPRLDPILAACGAAALNIDKDTTSFVFANPVIVGKRQAGLPRWQRRLFELMQRNSRTLPTVLEIKANRQIQLGVEVAV